MKANLIRAQFLLLCLLGFYPLLRFNFSSLIFILFTTFSTIIGVIYGGFSFKRQNAQNFLFLSGYVLLLYISIVYSENTDKALKRAIQFLPLLIAPFFVSFYQFQFPKNTKKKALETFVLVNIGYTVIISIIFVLNLDKTNLGLPHFLFDYDKFQYIVARSINNDWILIHKAYFSMGFVICAVFCLDQAIKLKIVNNKQFRVYVFAFFYLLFWLFYAFSFPNIVAFGACILLVLYSNVKTKKFLTLSLLFVLGATVLIFIKQKDIDVQRGFNFMKSSVDEQEYEVNDVRKEIYKSHLNILKSADVIDLIFGHGIGDVQDLLNRQYQERYSEKVETNLLFFNEEFDNLYWFKNNAAITNNTIESPDGNKNAELLFQNRGNSDSIASYSLSTNIDINQFGLYTLSVFAKKGHSSSMILRLGEMSQRAVFDIERGELIEALSVDTAYVSKEKNDWYRCVIQVDLKKNPLALIGMSNKNGNYHYKSEGSSFYIWGAQLEKGKLSEYKKNGLELLHKTQEKQFNSHNNYLYMFLAIGVMGLLAFLLFLGFLFKRATQNKDVLKITFCTVLAINFLTENIFLRQWGLLFFVFSMLVLFSKNKNQTIGEAK